MTANPDVAAVRQNKISSLFYNLIFETQPTENTCDIRWHRELLLVTAFTVFQLTTQMQELDSGTIDDLRPKETKVTEIDQMEQEIASKFLLHYVNSTFTDKGLACRRQSAVTNVAAQQNTIKL